MPIADPLRILFIVNPKSGNGDRQEMDKIIRDYFEDSPHQTEYYELSGENDTASIQYWVRNWKPDRVVAAGGDGTLKAVASVMKGKQIPLGILPAGSANGLAKELGIPEDFKTCLDIITGNNTGWMDLISINDGDLCLHLSDFGLNAHLIKHFEESDSRGKWGYAKEVLKVMRSKQQLGVQVKTGNKIIFRKAWMVIIANARMYGTGAMINPKGNLQDSLFEVIILRQLSLFELLKMLIKNRRLDEKKTEILQTSHAEIAVKQGAHFQIDGEYKGIVKKVTAKVLPTALLLLLPAPANTSGTTTSTL